MSTVKYNNLNQRIALLLRMNEQIFHAEDLQKIWNIKEKNTLYTTLKRYTQNKVLYRVYRGLYSIISPEKLDLLLLGIKAVHGFCYISLETVLGMNGVIQQDVSYITIAGESSRKFAINTKNGNIFYYVRKLKDEYLYQDIGIDTKNGVRMASTERAVADLMYFNPKYYFDNPRAISWTQVKKIQKQIAYPIIKKYDST